MIVCNSNGETHRNLVKTFLLAQKDISVVSGQIFNIGGGPANTTSLFELLKLNGELHGRTPEFASMFGGPPTSDITSPIRAVSLNRPAGSRGSASTKT